MATMLSGKNGNPGSENTTVAILNKQNELYYEGMRLINAEIDAIVPTGVDYRWYAKVLRSEFGMMWMATQGTPLLWP